MTGLDTKVINNILILVFLSSFSGYHQLLTRISTELCVVGFESYWMLKKVSDNNIAEVFVSLQMSTLGPIALFIGKMNAVR